MAGVVLLTTSAALGRRMYACLQKAVLAFSGSRATEAGGPFLERTAPP